MVLKFGESNVPVLDVDARKYIALGDLVKIDILPDDKVDNNTVKISVFPTIDGLLGLRVSDRNVELDLDAQNSLMSMMLAR